MEKSVSFELCDHSGTGKIEQDEMERLLVSINDTASYFGDPVLKRAQIKVGGVSGRLGGLDLVMLIRSFLGVDFLCVLLVSPSLSPSRRAEQPRCARAGMCSFLADRDNSLGLSFAA